MYIKKVKVANFRTFSDFEIELDRKLEIIVWSNNSWKSNFLRALDLFFNGTVEWINFSRERDVPFHIAHGSWSFSDTYIETELFLEKDEISKFSDLKNKINNEHLLKIRTYYDKDWNEKSYYSDIKWIITKGKNEIKNDWKDSINKLFKRIKFIYIPAQLDLVETINKLVSDEIFPSMMDSYWNSWLAKDIKNLKSKIDEIDDLAQKILDEKNLLLSQQFQETLTPFEEITAWINIKDFSLEVSLNKNETLSSILSSRINLLIKDASHNTIDSKWSWIQKMVLITLLEYFSQTIESKARYTNPFLIWWIDEPETYMQPKLQKEVKKILNKTSETNQIILTTHSPKMIDINNIDNIKLFFLETEIKNYTRKPWKLFYQKITNFLDKKADNFVDKLKEHIWVEPNDWWLLKNKNILFEWNDDQIYFYSTYSRIMWKQLYTWTIICDSSTNMPSYVEFINQQITNEELKAEALFCLLDDDDAWRQASKKISKKKYISLHLTPSLYLDISDNKNSNYPKMIEDLMIPEVFYESIIHFLNKNKEIHVTELSKFTFDDFYKERLKQKRTPMMEFVDNYFDDIIKQFSWFSFKELNVKFWLSKIYSDMIWDISDERILLFRKKYNILTDFLEKFN